MTHSYFSLALLAIGLLAGCAGEPSAPATEDTPAVASESAVEEIRVLQALPALQSAFASVVAMEPRTMQDLIYLTEIPAPPFGEGPRGEAFAALMAEAGPDSLWTDAEGNVIARVDGVTGDRTVAFGAHLDTVFPAGTDVTVRMRGDTLYAPGVGDDTRGLVVLLAMLRAIRSDDLRFEDDLLLIGTVGEEGLGDLRGMRYLFGPEGPGIDAFIAVDGGPVGNIVNEALGSNRYRVTVSGPGGHSWGAFGAGNPAHALGTMIHLFSEKAEPYTANGPRTSYSVGRIEGGTSVNAIPDAAWMEVDMRSVNPDRLAGIDGLLKEAVAEGLAYHNRLKRSGPELTASVESIGQRPSGATPADAPLVQRSLASARALGGDASLSMSSTDANIPISLGIPAVTIGRGGDSGNAHALDEWWLNKDGHLGIHWALLLAAAEARIVSTGD
ncbi:MAG: M20/M25/M40 family metallo-hydrolase [Rhodothermales bacterium]|nr:M20/M25/M40 family metallo-hydrolase [Rhodothermales bacterium]